MGSWRRDVSVERAASRHETAGEAPNLGAESGSRFRMRQSVVVEVSFRGKAAGSDLLVWGFASVMAGK